MTQRTADLLILGGGISGLAAALMAEKLNVDYVLIEKAPKIGGLTRTMNIGDYLFDYTGHLLHLAKYDTVGEIAPGLNPDQWHTMDRNAKCYYDGDLIDAPFQYNLGQLPQHIAHQIYNSYLSAEHESDCDSFDEYLVSRFGSEMASAFLLPYNEKLLAADLTRISKNAISRFFPPPDFVRINQGLNSCKNISTQDNLYNSKFYYPKTDGIQRLVDDLYGSLNNKKNIKTLEEVVSVDTRLQKVITTLHAYTYNTIISSIPLPELLLRIHTHDKLITRYVSLDLSYSSVLCIHLGVRGKPLTRFRDIHWIYFSEKKYIFYRVGFYSHFSEYMSPPGTYSLYVEIGINPFVKNNFDILVKKAIEQLQGLQLIKISSVEQVTINVIKHGYVHYTHKMQDIVTLAYEQLKDKNIYLIGRYGKWQYSSMEDSILEGKKMVENIYGKH